MVMEAHRSDLRTEPELIDAARLGDRKAFEELVAPRRRELHLHCYRMTGSLTDADDMLQETLLKAWRGVARFEPQAPFRAWLYKIATNTCLNELAARKHPRFLVPDQWSGGPPVTEITHLQPYPDRLLDEISDPATYVTRKEDVALAFIAAIQLLPPRQRAVLILREVLGWSAKEVADGLDTSAASVNSALQRARATLRTRRGHQAPGDLHALSDDAELKLLTSFIEAWERADFDGLAALLQEDAVLAMPPMPSWFRGRAAIIEFLSTGPADGDIEKIRLVPLRSNRQPATAAYIADPEEGGYQFYGLMVFSMEGNTISAITGFPNSEIGDYFALPSWMSADRATMRTSDEL
jgi:RNA polymerase sigma-70 factor, ECF subfamily